MLAKYITETALGVDCENPEENFLESDSIKCVAAKKEFLFVVYLRNKKEGSKTFD